MSPLIMLILAILGVPLVLALITLLFQWLWNITMPDVFDLRRITFWQAFRLLLLFGAIFGPNIHVG